MVGRNGSKGSKVRVVHMARSRCRRSRYLRGWLAKRPSPLQVLGEKDRVQDGWVMHGRRRRRCSMLLLLLDIRTKCVGTGGEDAWCEDGPWDGVVGRYV